MLSSKRKCEGGTEGPAKVRRKTLLLPSSKGKNCKIKVYIRLRPFNSSESSDRPVVEIIEENPSTNIIFDPKVTNEPFYFKGEVQQIRDLNKKVNKNQVFEFDEVFPYQSTNKQVFDSTAKTIVGSILDGFNCSVFAYGATGSGKTYTMLGKEDSPGISYLTIMELLSQLENNKDRIKTSISVSYIEVYNEEVRDLLSPGGKKLELREECGITCISGMKLINISDTRQLYTLLEAGNRMRTQHPTDSNAESSRSHAVFQVHVRLQEKLGGQVKAAKLTMIDLAGSERGGATGYKGKQFKEGRAINQSLLALGNCINALADGQKFVPYRDSKLTRILKDSLGGNCQTIMIANISPSLVSYEETYNTLKYATRARSIVTTANQNLVSSHLGLGQYKQIVCDLKKKLSQAETFEAELSNLSSWQADVERVMSERVKLLKEAISLQSQKTITEWRLAEALALQNKGPPEYLSNRLPGSIDQWQNRIEALRKRLEEYIPKISQNNGLTQSLAERMESSFSKVSDRTKRLYKAIYSDWDTQVKMAVTDVEKQHYSTLIKLMAKSNEALSSFRDDMFPSYDHFFKLLKAYNLATPNVISDYELVVKRLQGLKYVSWEDWDNSEERHENHTSLGRYMRLTAPDQVRPTPATQVLSVPSVHQSVIIPTMLDKHIGIAPRYTEKRYPAKSPLRTIQPMSKPIGKSGSKTHPNKIKQMTTSLNKENIIRESVKKQLYADLQKPSKNRTPYKSASFAKLRTPI